MQDLRNAAAGVTPRRLFVYSGGLLRGRVRHTYGENLEQAVENEAGDFIYIKPGVPHEVYNIGDGPLIAFVARSTADEWDKIVNYPSRHRPLPDGA